MKKNHEIKVVKTKKLDIRYDKTKKVESKKSSLSNVL